MDDDLYDDLGPSSSLPVPQSQPQVLTMPSVPHLEAENIVLRNNISVLFRTAREELKRKDKEIERLREEVARLSVVTRP